MKKKRILSCLLAAGLFISSGMPMTSLAASTAASREANESYDLTDANLTEVLKKVKQKINIPKEYTVFNYEYTAKNSYKNDVWYFYWNNEDGDSRIYVTSDIDANILTYSVYNYNTKSTPKYLKSELQDKAEAFIKKTAGGLFDKLMLTSKSYTGNYNNNYNYVYTRVENGILTPGQQIIVGINAETGAVERFDSSSWNYDILMPEKDIKVTKEQAIEKLRSQITMNLSYKSNYTYDEKGNSSVKAYLVYEPSISYISVDAASGEIYTTLNQWNLTEKNAEENGSSSSTMDSTARDEGSNLTEAEMAKIAELEGLITKQEAINLVKKNSSLYIDSKAVITTASLIENSYMRSSDEKGYYWNLQFSSPDTEKNAYYSSYTRAMVDAKSGEIISFHTNKRDYYYYLNTGEDIPSVKYTEAQSKKIFETFVKAQNKERFENVKLSNISSNILGYIEEKEIYGGYSLNYNRVYDGINYFDNYVYGTVDAVTGKVTSYGYNWNDSTAFEKAENIISAEKAYQAYMNYDGFDLVYELNTIHTETSMTQEARLVYQVNISPAYVSPFTGKQLDYNGNVYVNQNKLYQYTDISGHQYERSILLLADIGTGFSEAKFNPDKAITKAELQQLTETVVYVNNNYKLTGSARITRQDAAAYAVKILGLEKLAGISGIYKLDAADADKINHSHIGYTAIAKGLGLLQYSENNEFRPTENLTRAEAFDMLLTLLGTSVN